MFPSFGKYFMPELNDTYNTDIEKARELLKEAGFEDGFSFTITVPSNYQPHIDTAQVLKEEFKKIGVDAQIQLIEWDSWVSDVYQNRLPLLALMRRTLPALPCYRDLPPIMQRTLLITVMLIMMQLLKKQSAAPTMMKRPNIIRNVSGFCRKMQPTFIFRTYRSLWH